MESKKDLQARWLKKIGNHCALYSPCFAAINRSHNTKIHLLIDKEHPDQKEINNFYLCPLCLNNYVFIENDLIYGSEEFDMDHYPPRSVGGKKAILVCKKCNGSYGAKFDHSIKNYLNFQAFLKKKKMSLKSYVSINNVKGNYSSSLGWDGDKLINVVNFKKYPLLAEGLRKASYTNEELKLSFKFFIPDESVIHKSLLKAAYLSCFELFGYEFAFSFIGRNIIDVLNDKLVHPLTNLGVFKDESINGPSDGLYIIEDPKEFQCFMFICKSSLNVIGENSTTFVLIPKFGPDAWEQFKSFQILIPKGEHTFSLTKVEKFTVKTGEHLGYSKTSSLFNK